MKVAKEGKKERRIRGQDFASQADRDLPVDRQNLIHQRSKVGREVERRRNCRRLSPHRPHNNDRLTEDATVK